MNKYRTLKDDLQDILNELKQNGENRSSADNILPGLTYQTDHVFPDKEALLRFAGAMDIGFYRTLAIMLKSLWEQNFSCAVKGWNPQGGGPLMPVFLNASEREMRAANFNPDTGELFDLLEGYKSLVTQAGYQEADFDTVVQQMILSGLHRVGNNGREISSFTSAETKRIRMFKDISPENQEKFWSVRCQWTQLQNSLDVVLEQIETRRLWNAETKRTYLAVFGKDEVKLQEAIYRHCDLNRRKLLKEANPDINEEQLGELVAREEELHRKELEDLTFQTFMAPILERRLIDNPDINYDLLREYKQRAKMLLRKLAMKIHIDRLQHDPAYKKLTPQQRDELGRMLREAVGISFSELGFLPGHSMRTVSGLEDALERVDAILRNAGIETRIEMVIQGETPQEQLAWLKRACRSIEQRIESAKAELLVLATDEETKRMQSVLDHPEQHDKMKQAIQGETAEYEKMSDELQIEIMRLFNKQ